MEKDFLCRFGPKIHKSYIVYLRTQPSFWGPERRDAGSNVKKSNLETAAKIEKDLGFVVVRDILSYTSKNQLAASPNAPSYQKPVRAFWRRMVEAFATEEHHVAPETTLTSSVLRAHTTYDVNARRPNAEHMLLALNSAEPQEVIIRRGLRTAQTILGCGDAVIWRGDENIRHLHLSNPSRHDGAVLFAQASIGLQESTLPAAP